jgi:hypothetical protein
MMLVAQIDRTVRSSTPFLRKAGLSDAEITFVCRATTYTARGHHIFTALASSTLSDVVEGSFASQRALIAEYLRRHNAA